MELKRKKEILTLWNRNAVLNNETNYHETFKHYYENMSKNGRSDDYSVDDITWNDLDMTKIFREINYTFTSVGEEMLYYKLKKAHVEHDPNENMIHKITNNPQYRNRLSLILAKAGKVIHANSSKYIFNKPDHSFNKMYLILSILPVVGIGVFFLLPTAGLTLLIVSALTNVSVFYSIRSKNESEYGSLFYSVNLISASRKLAKLNNDQTFLDQTRKISKAPYVSVLLVKEDPSGTNILLHLFTLLKSIFLIDYIVFHYVINLINHNQELYEKVWLTVGKVDCLYATALWRKNLPYYCLPNYNDENILTVKDVYHPLLNKPVGNHFKFSKNTLLTGSNASGKSTFIKTIATNVIMSQALNTSTSKDISLTRGLVYSSMAVTDDIEKGQSYFLSEVYALKRILDVRDRNKENFIYLFVDEIFKGTNTIERVAAAESVLSYLNDYNKTKIMAATHDLELTDKLSAKYCNYHFREQIINDEITFDYIIKSGPSRTKNAIELLRLTGFPRDVYTKALCNAKD
ncbi:MutS-related protein [Lentibacillus sp. JNUCC-1]|uniref:MutS-related protein n=1 Tax=Lentibacillus sp. JNUCC-1 TaxID=2654513 RepID=UPI0018D24B52|nr:hypothetical protein [Lentibacillus sp. JNUCC-1]